MKIDEESLQFYNLQLALTNSGHNYASEKDLNALTARIVDASWAVWAGRMLRATHQGKRRNGASMNLQMLRGAMSVFSTMPENHPLLDMSVHHKRSANLCQFSLCVFHTI